MNRTLQLIALILLCSAQMLAQPTACFDFEDIPAGTLIGPRFRQQPRRYYFL